MFIPLIQVFWVKHVPGFEDPLERLYRTRFFIGEAFLTTFRVQPGNLGDYPRAHNEGLYFFLGVLQKVVASPERNYLRPRSV